MRGQGNPEVKDASRTLQLLQGRWTIEILYAMRVGPVRLSELKRLIPKASKKALTARLRLLESFKVIERRDFSTSVLRVEYEIVENMRGPLEDLLLRLSGWGRDHIRVSQDIPTHERNATHVARTR